MFYFWITWISQQVSLDDENNAAHLYKVENRRLQYESLRGSGVKSNMFSEATTLKGECRYCSCTSSSLPLRHKRCYGVHWRFRISTDIPLVFSLWKRNYRALKCHIFDLVLQKGLLEWTFICTKHINQHLAHDRFFQHIVDLIFVVDCWTIFYWNAWYYSCVVLLRRVWCVKFIRRVQKLTWLFFAPFWRELQYVLINAATIHHLVRHTKLH